MLVNLRYKEVKVRRRNSHLYKGDDKFTGIVTYSVVGGALDGERIRLSLGTEEKNAAIRRVSKIEKACAEGPQSLLWPELEESLPPATFKLIASRIGYVGERKATGKSRWQDLCDVYEIEMQRKIDNKKRGASSKEGIMAESTRERYRTVIKHFTEFLGGGDVPLEQITKATLEKYKAHGYKAITQLAQARGGSSIALDIAVLHGVFNFGLSQELLVKKPISMKTESKPGENPKNGARPFTGEELKKLREVAGEDLFTFLVLRWTGLRGSDAINLSWKNVHFDRGVNGEIETLTQKRSKVAIIPLSTEISNTLQQVYRQRKAHPEDRVLSNPRKDAPFVSRARLYERCKALGIRAGVKRVTPHCFRDTFACDMLARGVDIYDVAKMLADTVDTVEKHYAQFIPAIRDNVQAKMDSGVGIEERTELARQRGRKIVEMVRQVG